MKTFLICLYFMFHLVTMFNISNTMISIIRNIDIKISNIMS